MSPLFLASALAVALCAPAAAQERTASPSAQVVLREWPRIGVWQIALVRLVDGRLGCLLLTGHANQSSGERYFWGIRHRDQNIAAVIIDNNQGAITGTSIKIVVDQIPVGTYQIGRKGAGDIGFHFVIADLPTRDGTTLSSLIKVGGTLQFVTDTATYTASLQGAQQALINLDVCMLEANHLNNARSSEASPPARP